MVQVEADVVLRVKGKTYRFENMRHEVCGGCGERIFGLDASRLFDQKILSRRKSRAA
jgi:YgiT-type zinc finger domain-containing protein